MKYDDQQFELWESTHSLPVSQILGSTVVRTLAWVQMLDSDPNESYKDIQQVKQELVLYGEMLVACLENFGEVLDKFMVRVPDGIGIAIVTAEVRVSADEAREYRKRKPRRYQGGLHQVSHESPSATRKVSLRRLDSDENLEEDI
jgi:hypothetical protein